MKATFMKKNGHVSEGRKKDIGEQTASLLEGKTYSQRKIQILLYKGRTERCRRLIYLLVHLRKILHAFLGVMVL